MGHSDQSPEEKHQDNKHLSNKNNTVRTEGRPTEQPQNSESSDRKEKWWKRVNQSFLTVVLTVIISLCALFVSIYQTRILYTQNKVMIKQQQVMNSSVRAQFWPLVEISRSYHYSEGVIDRVNFNISNNGTGPAIIRNIVVQFQGSYVNNWEELFELMNVSDSTFKVRDNSLPILDRVLKAGHYSTILTLSSSQPQVKQVVKIIEEQGIVFTICYKSVFDEYWYGSYDLKKSGNGRTIQVETCLLSDSTDFFD